MLNNLKRGISDNIKQHFNRTQKRCWEFIDKKYPEHKTKYNLSLDLVQQSIDEIKAQKEPLIILDAGCGHSSGISYHLESNIFLLGTDFVLNDLRNNLDIDSGFVCNLEKIPIKANSIDIIFANMVLEHIAAPKKFFEQIENILKPGGYFIFATPCIYNIAVFPNLLIPNTLSRKLSAALTGVAEDDVFPTFYRANSNGKIRKLFKGTRMKKVDLIMYQPPPYAFVFSTLLCRLIVYYYRVINKYDSLKFLRGIIISRWRKYA
jgi:SAM-dependent methyltransferase